MSFVRNFLKFTRGVIPESLIRSVLNRKLVGIAHILELEIGSEAVTARLKLVLAGEKEPVTIYIDDCQFRREGDRAWITFGCLRSDREWLQNVLERFVAGKSFELPEDKVELVEGLLS